MSVGRVLIVGGGIGGLATAAGLRQAHIECEVVERTERWAPVGAGIVLSVNAMSVMRKLGMADDVARRGVELGRGAITNQAGSILGNTDFGVLRRDFGPTIALHRAELHHALLEAVGDVPISLGTSVEKISQNPARDDAPVEVRLTDGREETYDLVIGADGLRSQVRELALGEVPIAYSGYTCWRLIVNAPIGKVDMCEMWGRGQRFGIVGIGDGRLYCFAVANASRGQTDPSEGRLERFRARFEGFGGQVPAILAALEHPDQLIHNDLEELPRGDWVKGRVVLIGDAAHAMTPNMGQGAAMALEDSAVLVETLGQSGPLADRLKGFHARRGPRVRWVQNQSRRIGRVGQLEGVVACAVRNAVVRLTPDRAAEKVLRKIASQPI